MVIDHDEARELLPDFALDLLDQEEHGEILNHLRGCDVCLTEAQLYLQGARALSLAAAHEPRALSLRTFVLRVPDGALDRIRARVIEGPDSVHDAPAHRSAPSREVAEAGAGRSGWRLFGRPRGKEVARGPATGLLERDPRPGAAFAEAVGAAASNLGRRDDGEDFDDFDTDSFEDLLRPDAPPPQEDGAAPADDLTYGAETAPANQTEAEAELELTDLAQDMDWLLLGTVETEQPFDSGDPADHLWDAPETNAAVESPPATEPPRRQRRILGRHRGSEDAAPAEPGLPGSAPPPPDPGPPSSQRLAARMHTEAAHTSPPATAPRRRLFGGRRRPPEPAIPPVEDVVSRRTLFELAAPAAAPLEELTGTPPGIRSLVGGAEAGSPSLQPQPEGGAAPETDSVSGGTTISQDATSVEDGPPGSYPGDPSPLGAADSAGGIDELLSGIAPEEAASPDAPRGASATLIQRTPQRRRFGLGRRSDGGEVANLAPPPEGRKRRFLGRRAVEPVADEFESDIYAEALAIPGSTAAPASAPARPLVSPAAIPGLGGYDDDEPGELDDERDDGPSTVGARWKAATFVLALAVIVLVGGLGFTFYTLLSTHRDLSAIEARLPSYGIQVAFKGEDLQGIGYFSTDYRRGVLALDGIKPAPVGKTIVVWSTSRKDGTRALSALSADRNGGRTYFELRRVPPDVVRIFATVETVGRAFPPAPTGPEVFTGDAPFQAR